MVTQIGFGAIKLPRIDERTASECLNRALDLGINFIDTARNYKDSEAKIGKTLKGRRDEYYLATKSSTRDAEGLLADLETSLTELQTDVIDVYQLHTVSDENTWEKVMSPGGALEAAKKAQQQGKFKHLGLSVHRALPVMRKAIECGEFETVMLAYSALDQEGVEDEILPLAKEHDLGVITMKPLSGGLLVGAEEGQGNAEADPVVRGSLRYVLANDAVSVAIPGMQCVKEVEENAATGEMAGTMADEERDSLIALLGSLKKEYRYGQVCLRCEYCLPCPQEIEIPAIFRALEMAENYPDALKRLGKELYDSLEVKPDACEKCETCMEKCPAGINIPERLQAAAQALAAFEL